METKKSLEPALPGGRFLSPQGHPPRNDKWEAAAQTRAAFSVSSFGLRDRRHELTLARANIEWRAGLRDCGAIFQALANGL